MTFLRGDAVLPATAAHDVSCRNRVLGAPGGARVPGRRVVQRRRPRLLRGPRGAARAVAARRRVAGTMGFHSFPIHLNLSRFRQSSDLCPVCDEL